MSESEFSYEPMITPDNKIQVIVSNPNTGEVKEMDYNELQTLCDKKFSNAIFKFCSEHHLDWKYPTALHLKDCLDPIEGWNQFDMQQGNYCDRLKNVSCRIMQYLEKHVYLSGAHDAALITTFVVATYYKKMFEYAPRLLIHGVTNSGKSVLLDILKDMCYRGNASGDTTAASLFRMIDSYGITPLLDEFQDYDRDTRNGIKKILKNGNVKDHCVQRAEKNSNNSLEPKTYNIYAPVVFVNQAGGKLLSEEIINRAISILMIAAPDCSMPMIPDRDELRDIRDELYTIRCVWLADPKRVGLKSVYESCIAELQNPNGIVTPAGTYYFSNRCRDILGTMYPVAKMIGTDEAVLESFADLQKSVSENDKNSKIGKVFAGLIRAIEVVMETEPLCTDYLYALSKVETRDIAECYSRILIADGEMRDIDKLPTREVTNTLREMGFKTHLNNYNHSVFNLDRLADVFQTNLLRFGSKDAIQKYGNNKTKKSSNSVNSVVKDMCQTPQELNNLTRSEVSRGC